MKKTVCAAIALAAVVALSGCSSSSPSLNANWYKDTTITAGISNTYEKLTYAVTAEEGTNPAYSVTYSGSYETVLRNTIYTWEDGTVEDVYTLTSTLRLLGSYTFTATGEKHGFEDEITSEVIFRPVSKTLSPIYSEKYYRTTVPNAPTPASAAEMCTVYEYTDVAVYDKAGETATVTRKRAGETETTEVRLSGTVFDNEQLLFVLRCLAFSSTSLKIVNAEMQQLATVTVTAGSQLAEFETNFNGEARTIAANRFSIALSASLPGASQTLTYAQTTAGNNVYHTALLEMSTPLPYLLGTLTYTLTEAEFTTK